MRAGRPRRRAVRRSRRRGRAECCGGAGAVACARHGCPGRRRGSRDRPRASPSAGPASAPCRRVVAAGRHRTRRRSRSSTAAAIRSRAAASAIATGSGTRRGRAHVVTRRGAQPAGGGERDRAEHGGGIGAGRTPRSRAAPPARRSALALPPPPSPAARRAARCRDWCSAPPRARVALTASRMRAPSGAPGRHSAGAAAAALRRKSAARHPVAGGVDVHVARLRRRQLVGAGGEESVLDGQAGITAARASSASARRRAIGVSRHASAARASPACEFTSITMQPRHPRRAADRRRHSLHPPLRPRASASAHQRGIRRPALRPPRPGGDW